MGARAGSPDLTVVSAVVLTDCLALRGVIRPCV
jgi:hypothetical protein